MHIGLIGGIGPAATEYYYRGLIERYARSDKILDLTIVHADLRELARNLVDRAAQRQAEAFLRLVRRLASAGAELAAITSMGGHFCVEELMRTSPLPILNAIPEVEAVIRRRNLNTIGILGTRMVMETALYGGIRCARVVLPEGDALEQVHSNYFEMAVAACHRCAAPRLLLYRTAAVSRTGRRGCDPRRHRSVSCFCRAGLRVPGDRLCRGPSRRATPQSGRRSHGMT
jgi:aspartate racemase